MTWADKVDEKMGKAVTYAGPPQASPNPASWWTRTKAAVVDDPQTKAKIYAQARFPNDPNAITRYEMGGDPVYVQNGTRYYEKPTGITGGISNLSASLAGSLPTEVGAGTGGLLGFASGGPIGGLVGAFLGGAGGEGWRKVLGNVLHDEPQTVGGNVQSMATMGGLSTAGEGGGQLFNKWLNRRLAQDIDRLDTNIPGRRYTRGQEAAQLGRKAQEKGVYLTPAEKTNLESLKAQQKMVSKMPETSDQMSDMYLMRKGQIEKAVEKELDSISPVVDADLAGDMARKAAKSNYDDIVTERAAKAKPLYDEAKLSGPVDVSDITYKLDQTIDSYPEGGSIQTKLKKVKKMLSRDVDGDEFIEDDFELLSNAKKELWDMRNPKKKNLNRELDNVRKAINERLIEISGGPNGPYATANKIWGEGATILEKLDGNLIKKIAEMPDEQLQKAALTILDPKNRSPKDIARLRGMFMLKDPDSWNAVVRTFIQDTWEKAGKQFASNSENLARGGKFSAQLFRDDKSIRILKAAMSPEQFQSLVDLTDVLRATTRALDFNSDTAWKQAMQGQFKEQAEGFIPKLLKPRQSVIDWIVNARIGKRATEIADIISDPTNRHILRELKRMNPEDENFIAAFSAILPVATTAMATD